MKHIHGNNEAQLMRLQIREIAYMKALGIAIKALESFGKDNLIKQIEKILKDGNCL